MPRPEKVQAVAEIRERLEGAHAVFLAEYAGLSVKEQQALRRELRDNDAEFKVVKMTLARRAAAELEIDELDELLLGPTGIAYAEGDPVSAAKALREFAKGHDVFAVKGGLLGREFLSPERIAQLADVEPREVLLAKLAGAMQAPLANMAGLLAALPRNAATAMQQLLEAKEEAGPEPEAVAAEPEAAEVPEPEAAEVPEPEAAEVPEPEPEPEAAVEPEPVADAAAEAETAVDEPSPETEPEAAAVEPPSGAEGAEPQSDEELDAEPAAEADADSDATESEIEASADAPADTAGAEAEDQSEAADQADEE